MVKHVGRSRREISEITHIVPVRLGLVPERERGADSAPISYADRLKTMLGAFHRREDQGFPSVIRLFEGIHFAKWALIDGDTRLLLSVVFDGDWHDYLRALAFDVPYLLHLIWSNTLGWRPVVDDPDALFAFIHAHQVRVPFFYAHHPELTVRDIDWLQRLSANVEAQAMRDCGQGWPTGDVAPVPTSARRKLLLESFDRQHGPLHSVQQTQKAFMTLVGMLYDASVAKAAYNEAFGEDAQGIAP